MILFQLKELEKELELYKADEPLKKSVKVQVVVCNSIKRNINNFIKEKERAYVERIESFTKDPFSSE